jgi:hypothetical protein
MEGLDAFDFYLNIFVLSVSLIIASWFSWRFKFSADKAAWVMIINNLIVMGTRIFEEYY